MVSLAGSAAEDVIPVDQDALEFLADSADGDARVVLITLELAGLAAFASWESTPRRSCSADKASTILADANAKVVREKDRPAEDTK